MTSLEVQSQKTYIPNLKWYQTSDNLFIDFEVINSKNHVIKITENRIYFSVISNDLNYIIDFEFFSVKLLLQLLR